MSDVLHQFYVSLTDPKPPSVNGLYTNGYRGRRVLSKAGEAFKAALTHAVVTECLTLPWKDAVEAVYRERAWVRLTIGFHTALYNGAWTPGGRTAGGAQQSPYKTLDGSNYIKAIEDAIKDGTGIDDSAHLSTTIEKLDDTDRWIDIAYEVLTSRRPRG